jgi:hypothetical protein
MGDVIIVVDILTKVLTDTAVDGQRPTGTVDFVRSSVDKLLHHTVLMSNIILPEIVEGRTRSNLIPVSLREGYLRINGMNVYRLQIWRCFVSVRANYLLLLNNNINNHIC